MNSVAVVVMRAIFYLEDSFTHGCCPIKLVPEGLAQKLLRFAVRRPSGIRKAGTFSVC